MENGGGQKPGRGGDAESSQCAPLKRSLPFRTLIPALAFHSLISLGWGGHRDGLRVPETSSCHFPS